MAKIEEKAFDKAAILASARWSRAERLLLDRALAAGARVTVSQAEAALKAIKERKVK